MKKELLIAASLVLTHAYSRRAEALCESDLDLSEDSKKFIRGEVEQHCNFIMELASKPLALQTLPRPSAKGPRAYLRA